MKNKEIKILLSAPRGFCAGVERAIEIVEKSIQKYGAPVYVRHEIVHNKYVVDDLKDKGAIFVEELEEIKEVKYYPNPTQGSVNIETKGNLENLYLSDVKPQKKIILRDRCQPESTITLKEYLYYRVDKSRIVAGKNMLEEYDDILSEISRFFGIQPRFIIAVLGMESFYGRNQGKIDTITAVTTLAFDRRRSNFYRKQLFAALKILIFLSLFIFSDTLTIIAKRGFFKKNFLCLSMNLQ